jgi:hypothetical protein
MLTVLKMEPPLSPSDRNLHLHRLLLRPLQRIFLKMMPTVIPAWETLGMTLRIRKTTLALESTSTWR